MAAKNEADEIWPEDLEAAAELMDDLIAGTHYTRHEAALYEMYGANPHRQIYMPKPKESTDNG